MRLGTKAYALVLKTVWYAFEHETQFTDNDCLERHQCQRFTDITAMCAEKTARHPAAKLPAKVGKQMHALSVAVLINSNAGTVLEADRPAFTKRIIDAFAVHGHAALVVVVPGAELAREFARLAAVEDQLIVVAGGDGSVNAILPEAIRLKRLFAVLPLGTLNLIGKDLELTGNLESDIAAIVHGTDIDCDAIKVNEAIFHSNAGLGLFVTMAMERQEARRRFPFSKKLGFVWAAVKTMGSRNTIDITYDRDGVTSFARADAILVTNNRFTGTPWRRAQLDAGLLEVHILQAPTLMLRLKVLLATARGTWRDLDNLTITSATEMTLRRRWRSSMRVSVDGEVIRLANPARFAVLPGALRLRSGRPRSPEGANTELG